MKNSSLSAFVLAGLVLINTASAAGGYTTWYQSQFGGGNGYNQPINNGYVGTSAYQNNIPFNSGYNTPSYSQNYNNVGIGGYNTFSGNNGYSNSRGGGMTAYYAANGVYQNNNNFNNTGVSYTGYTPSYNNSNSTGGGYTGYFARNLQANTFANQCNPAPRPNADTCQGGTFQPITNGYGCTIEWRCEGGNYCPRVDVPNTQCNGVWKPQYNAGTQCLTHYFCDRTQDNPYPTNRPVISRFNGPTSLSVGETGTWTVVARSQDNNQLSYRIDWGDNLAEPYSNATRRISQTSTFTYQYSTPGTYTVRVTVANQYGLSATSTKTIQVRTGNYGTPTISSFTGPSILNVGEIGSWRVSANDQTDRPIEFSINWDQPIYYNLENHIGSAWGSTRTFQHAYHQPGVYRVTVTATSAGGSVSKSLTVRVQSQPAYNNVPVVHGISGPTSLRVGQTGTWRIQASDANNQDLRYQIDWGDRIYAAQSKSIMAPDNGFVQNSTFTHQYNQAGTYTVRVTVKNQAGKTAMASITVRVNADIPRPPYYPIEPNYNNGGSNSWFNRY